MNHEEAVPEPVAESVQKKNDEHEAETEKSACVETSPRDTDEVSDGPRTVDSEDVTVFYSAEDHTEDCLQTTSDGDVQSVEPYQKDDKQQLSVSAPVICDEKLQQLLEEHGDMPQNATHLYPFLDSLPIAQQSPCSGEFYGN